MQIEVNAESKSYPIVLERGSINNVAQFVPSGKNALIVYDKNVPTTAVNTICEQFPNSKLVKITGGEVTKSIDNYAELLQKCMDAKLTRSDYIIAVGGGTVGDLAGFTAATYMRGIHLIHVPTTILSAVDSSIGGKTGINFGGTKNVVGAFYQPDAVIIDLDVTKTLSERQVSNGLAEALKAGLIYDETLFELFEQDDYLAHIDEIVAQAIYVKKAIVEQDEREADLRQILNFGHTIGHGIEAHFGKYLHGEAIAEGMMYFIKSKELGERVEKITRKMNLPKIKLSPNDIDPIYELIVRDKKANADYINVVEVEKPGHAYICQVKKADINEMLKWGSA
ncbi:MAG: 3-dehydroquinate synthase [Bifidobacteriaceae bacterium]|jgi:3-dehydroquinate synthase|nr:3-dehydroquinate synthase [Bifidobacteriaceae bacterium]